MSVAVLVPYRGDGGHRDAAFSWLRARYEHFGLEVVTADDGGELFSRAASFNLAAEKTDADVLVLSDADAVVARHQLLEAMALALTPGLVIAYTRYFALAKWSTAQLLAQPVDYWQSHTPAFEWEMPGSISSVVACSRSTFEAAGGFDPRFRGWGFEDNAFHYAAGTLVGPGRRVDGDVWHLWHPSDPGLNPEAPTYRANRALNERYGAACGDRAAMRMLLNERMVNA